MSAQPSERRSRRPGRFRMFRKCLLGYQPQDVHQAIEERDAALAGAEERATRATVRVEELEHVSARLATMVVDRDRQLRGLRAELQRALERDREGARTMAALAEDLETVRRQARNQATRIRLRALREAAVLGERVAELEGAPGGSRERLMGRLEEAIERVGAEDDEEELAALATSNGHAKCEVGELFDGLVEVEVGPLSDFSQLVGLEDAASEIGAASEISVKRFTGGRATLAMRFKHPVELLRELEERAPFEFRVRDTRSNRIVLDLDE